MQGIVTVSKTPFLLRPDKREIKRYPVAEVGTVGRAAEKAMEDLRLLGFNEFVVTRNGSRVEDLDEVLVPGDFITVSVFHGVETLATTAFVASIASATGATAATVASTIILIGTTVIVSGIGMMVNSFMAPPTPDMPAPGDATATYTFGAKNPTLPGLPVPVIYGHVLQTPPILGSYRTQKWNPTIQPYGAYETWQYLALCLGSGVISNSIDQEHVFVGDECVTTYESFEWSVTTGNDWPTWTDCDKVKNAGFNATYHDRQFEKKLTKSVIWYPDTDPNEFQIETNGMANRVSFTLTFPRGLFWVDKNGITRWMHDSFMGAIQFVIYAVDQAGNFYQWSPEAITSNKQSSFDRQYWVQLPYRAVWTVGIKRTTADDPIPTLAKERYFSECVVTGFQEVLDIGQSYPGMRVGLLGVKATENVSGNLGVVKIEQTQAVIQVVGSISGGEFIDTGTMWVDSQNPAWAAYDLFTNPISGRGIAPSKLIYSLWDEWADWCADSIWGLNEAGTAYTVEHSRCRCNVSLETRSSLADQLKHIEDVGRARIFRIGDMWYPVIDKPKTESYGFGKGNIIEGSWHVETYEDPEKVDAIDISFWDKDRKFKKNTVRAKASWFEDLPYPPNVASLQLRACNDEDEAIRHATFRMQKTEMSTEYGSLTATVDAVLVEIGDVVTIVPPTATLGFTGKLSRDHGASSLLYLDQIVNMPAATFQGKTKVYFIDSENSFYSLDVIGPWDEDTQTILLSDVYTGKQFDNFAIGRPDEEMLLYQITDKKFNPATATSPETIDFKFTEYNEDMFYWEKDGVQQYVTTSGGSTKAAI
jgi:hypothetical protein